MSDISDDPVLPVRCRPDKSLWTLPIFLMVIVLFLVVLSLIVTKTPTTANSLSLSDIIAWFILGLIYFLPTLWWILWLLRGEIVADETGLHWRSVTKWHHATWEQIRDYYHTTLRSQEFRIETDNATLKVSNSLINNAPELRAAIQQYAQWARTKEWGVVGARVEIDWPLTFKYEVDAQLTTARNSVGFAIVWVLGFLWVFKALWQTVIDVWQYYGPGLALIGGCFYLGVALLAPIFAWASVAALKEARTRADEHITITQAGLIFEDDTRRVECTWDEIRDYYRDPMLRWQPYDDRYIVVTAKETFDFTLIGKSLFLKEIIQKYATETPYHQWRVYIPQNAANNVRIYNYRAREIRVLMLLPMGLIVLCSALALSPFSTEINPSYPANTWSMRIFMACYVLVSALLCLAYFVGSIEITESGIKQRGLRGRKFIAWNDVIELRGTKTGGYEIVGRNTRLGFHGIIVDATILQDEIARHAVNAKIEPSWTEVKHVER